MDSQIIRLASSGADTLLIAAGPKFAALAIRKAYDIDWRPTHFLAQVSAASPKALEAAGLDKAVGVITASSFKSVGDPEWANDPDYLAWLEFMRTDYPHGDVNDGFTFVGYSNAVLFAEVLRRCGDNLTRENLMSVATHLNGVRMPDLLPGITVNTSPTDYEPAQADAAASFRRPSMGVIHGNHSGLERLLGIPRRAPYSTSGHYWASVREIMVAGRSLLNSPGTDPGTRSRPNRLALPHAKP